MSIAVNLDNGIKLVELVWDFSLQRVHACMQRHSHTLTHNHTHRQRAVWALLINVGNAHVYILHTVVQTLPITIAQTDIRGT